MKQDQNISVVVPNWNGKDYLAICLDSLLVQTLKPHIIVVENGSTDGSLEFLQKSYPQVELIVHNKNKGFAGGVNAGIRRSIARGDEFVALFNNDAVADKQWLEHLANALAGYPKAGIVTCTFMSMDKRHLDSTGDQYTIWGLPYPRGRGESANNQYDEEPWVFGASGGASLYRISMLKEIGLFDEDFFAYYEDVDLSFRAQLTGWKVRYVAEAVAYHTIGATGGKIKGFTTYQTLKNLPLLLWKNVPWQLMPVVWPRLVLAYSAFLLHALVRRQLGPVAKGVVMGTVLWPKKLVERRKIQQRRFVSVGYLRGIMTPDLPPNAERLRRLRNVWWNIRRKQHGKNRD